MKIIYANIVLFIVVLYGLLGSAITRLNSSFWQEMDSVKTEYDIVWSLFSIWLIITIYGLLKKKHWAYVHTLSINAVLAFVPLLLFITTSAMLWQEIDHIQTLKSIIYELVVSFVAFVFWLILYKSSYVKKSYNKSPG